MLKANEITSGRESLNYETVLEVISRILYAILEIKTISWDRYITVCYNVRIIKFAVIKKFKKKVLLQDRHLRK